MRQSARKQDIMRLIQRVVTIITAALGGLALVASASPPVASASSARNIAQVAPTIGVTSTIPVGSLPAGVAADPLTNTIYVANFLDGTVSVISGKTNTVTATIPVAREPDVVAANPLSNTIYITNFSSDLA